MLDRVPGHQAVDPVAAVLEVPSDVLGEIGLVLRIKSSSLAPSAVVDRVVAALRELEPHTPVEVEIAASVELLDARRRRDLDLTVALLPVDDARLRVLLLGRYEFGLVVRSGDDLAGRAEITAEDLAGRHVLILSAGHPAALDHVTRWLTDARAEVERLPDADLMRAAQLVHHGRGVTLSGAAGSAAHLFAGQPGLTVVPIRDKVPRLELGLVWVRDPDPHPMIESFVDRLTTS